MTQKNHPFWQIIRTVNDFPKAGIEFYDITPLLQYHVSNVTDALFGLFAWWFVWWDWLFGRCGISWIFCLQVCWQVAQAKAWRSCVRAGKIATACGAWRVWLRIRFGHARNPPKPRPNHQKSVDCWWYFGDRWYAKSHRKALSIGRLWSRGCVGIDWFGGFAPRFGLACFYRIKSLILLKIYQFCQNNYH